LPESSTHHRATTQVKRAAHRRLGAAPIGLGMPALPRKSFYVGWRHGALPPPPGPLAVVTLNRRQGVGLGVGLTLPALRMCRYFG
jgi:hypothetical protein